MAKRQEKTVTGRVLHDPVKDKLRPMFPIDLSKCRTIDELVRAMGNTAFTGRQIGDAADVLETMARDKDCFVVMTLSGALTVAKMGFIFCDLIESGLVKAVVSTGALMAHGLVEATGHSHFRYDPKMDDKELFHAGYNRVYDSLEPEVNLDHVEEVMDDVLSNWNADEVACSWKIHRKIGETLHKQGAGRGILKSAYEHNVPVFVPAFSASENRAATRKEAAAAIRSVRGLREIRGHDVGYEAHGPFYGRWRGSAELVAAVWSLRGASGAARLQENSPEAIQLRRADLSRAGALGRIERQHLHGGGIVGQVCSARRGRQVRGSI